VKGQESVNQPRLDNTTLPFRGRARERGVGSRLRGKKKTNAESINSHGEGGCRELDENRDWVNAPINGNGSRNFENKMRNLLQETAKSFSHNEWKQGAGACKRKNTHQIFMNLTEKKEKPLPMVG